MSYLSQFLTSPWAKPTAGAAIAQNDLVEIGADGRAYKAVLSDYAAVNVPNTAVIPETVINLTNIILDPCGGTGRTSVTDADGNVYILSTTGNGVNLSKYDRNGILLVDATAALSLAPTTPRTVNIAFLSNGNLLISAASSVSLIQGVFIIYDPHSMTPLITQTQVNNTSSVNTTGLATMALAGGGFAALYAIGTSNNLQLSIYSNEGALTNSVVIGSASQLALYVYALGIVQLVGTTDIAVSYVSSAGQNLMVARYTTAAVLVGAATDTTIDYVPSVPINLSALSGFVAVALANTNAGQAGKAVVLDNSLAIQGSVFTTTTTVNMLTDMSSVRLLSNDGTAFWFFFNSFTKLTTAGDATTYYLDVPFDADHIGWSTVNDGCGNIVATGFKVDPSGSIEYTVFSTLLLRQLVYPTTTPLSPQNSATDSIVSQIYAIGDSVCLMTGSGDFMAVKTSTTNILGPANVAAAQGIAFPVNNLSAGVQPINQVPGTVGISYSSTLNGGGQIWGNQLMQLGVGANPNA